MTLLYKFKAGFWKPDQQRTQQHSTKTNQRKQEKFRINKKKKRKEKDYITISKETIPEKVEGDTEKLNKLLKHIPTDNNTEQNKLIYATQAKSLMKYVSLKGTWKEIQNMDGKLG